MRNGYLKPFKFPRNSKNNVKDDDFFYQKVNRSKSRCEEELLIEIPDDSSELE